MFAVPIDWKDKGTYPACMICNNVTGKVFSLTPRDDKGYTELEQLLGDVSNWVICDGCIEKFKKKTGYKIIIKNAEEIVKLEDKYFKK